MLGRILLAGLTTFAIGTGVYEDEPISTDPIVDTIEEDITSDEEEVVYTSFIELTTGKGGSVYTTQEKGMTGDIVTVYVSPYFLYTTESVVINGETITITDDNTYEFTLIEGTNTITTSFVVDNEQVQVWASLLADAKDGNWTSIFSKDTLLTILSWVLTTILSSGILITLVKNKNIKSKTAAEIANSVESISKSTIAEAINNYLNTTFGDTMATITSKLDGTSETCKTLARCFILAQEDTPEARLAIIQELTKLQTTEQELTEQVKAIIQQEVSKNQKIIEEQQQALTELKEANDAIEVEDTTKKDDDYGQI